MNKLYFCLLILFLTTGCSFKIPAGTYTTAKGMSFAGRNLTLTENGRFQFRFWTDDAPATIGHGAYIILGDYLFLIFENANVPKSNYTIQEIPCTQQDTQLVNFNLSQTSGKPIPFVSIYNEDNHSRGTMSDIDGIAQVRIPKEQGKKIFVTHYGFYEDVEIEIDGNKCYDIDITLTQENRRLQRGQARVYKLKRKGDQLFMKLYYRKKYSEIYLREN